ncbi:MAG: hypothetical protein ACK57U_01565 [Planctomycetota bacterium]
MHEEQCMKSAVHAKGKSKRTTFTAETAVIAEKPLSLPGSRCHCREDCRSVLTKNTDRIGPTCLEQVIPQADAVGFFLPEQ